MIPGLHDIIGTLGVILIVAAYAAVQFAWVRAESLVYSAANAVGAALILFSLLFDFNFSAFLMEAAWLGLSLYGISKALRASA